MWNLLSFSAFDDAVSVYDVPAPAHIASRDVSGALTALQLVPVVQRFSAAITIVHVTSFFDVAIVVVLLIVTYSLFDELYMINLFLLEYMIVLGIQFI